MRKRPVLTVFMVLVALVSIFIQPALAAKSDYVGDWTCVAMAGEDGVKQTEIDGQKVSDLIKMQIKDDGTMFVTSFGEDMAGTWEETDGGISTVVDSDTLVFVLKDGQLLAKDDDMTVYFEKAGKKPKTGGLLSRVLGSKYVGKWVAAQVDEGDGVLKTEMGGIKVSDLLAFDIQRGGTLTMTSMGEISGGVWHEIDGGINIVVDDLPTDMILKDGRLVADSDGATLYFDRAGDAGNTQAQPTPTVKPASVFAGEWTAIRCETAGYVLDIGSLFPDGCKITLNEDGAGLASVVAGYAEKISWSEKEGTLYLSGSYVFSDPKYDANKEELTFTYGGSTVLVAFKKDVQDASPVPTVEPIATLFSATVPPESTNPPLEYGFTKCETKLFQATFPGDGWVNNESWKYDRDDYSAVRYELTDGSGSYIATVSLSASSEGVSNYRGKIKQLQEYALKAGKDTLEETKIGGIAFQGAGYEDWGYNYLEYTARVPESSMTLMITVERPENISDLQSILDSVTFSLPTLTPPNVDPPLPEDGAPYVPETGSVSFGSQEVLATWLSPDASIILDSIFSNQIAASGDTLYVLAGKMLYSYAMKDGKLTPATVIPDSKMRLDNKFEYLSMAEDGILYVSDGTYNTLAVKDGAVLMNNSISGDVVMHPGGEWGISFWANADPKLVRASDGALTEEPWVLSDLSDADKRKGRFSSISCVSITDDRIYVAGNDTQNGDAQRVAVFDLDGKELFTFGSTDFSADDAFGSVTGIAEAFGGIFVLDGNYRSFKLFSKEGEFLGAADCDKLLGTDYPWLSSMVMTDDGVLLAAAQDREDGSGTELLVFRLTGM